MTTGFFSDERCFWHYGGDYALTIPTGGFVQPMPGGLPEGPEAKRRFLNLLTVSGLASELSMRSAPAASREQLLRVHPEKYLSKFKALSDAGGGELGPRAPFGKGGFEIAALSAGLATQALKSVLQGELTNAYALSRPPGHHCTADFPNGFCLLSNIAIAVEDALASGLATRVAVVDWDVHHGNGTESIFYDRPDVFTVSLHQERNYPTDTGAYEDRGAGKGLGANLNIPLPPGTGHRGYLSAMKSIVCPALLNYAPDAIIIACGYDPAALDPLGRMLATAETFREMTAQMMQVSEKVCENKLVLVHEGGYSEAYAPFCGHAVMEQLSGSLIRTPDPLATVLDARQPGEAFDKFVENWISEMRENPK